MNYGLIVAAGAGVRFGARKQFARLKDRPVIYYSLRAFELCPVVKETVLVTNLDEIDRMETLIHRWRMKKVNWIVAGGEQRQDSVARGLRVLPEKGMVAIHDGVRPIVSPERIEYGFLECRRNHAVIYALPASETIKQVKGSEVLSTIPREDLILVQTPQFFKLPLIREAYEHAAATGHWATDDAQLVEHLGGKVTVIAGWPENIKITTRSDLVRAAKFL
jgi:2-C-methyl-D-erythritol 4-phosphate cytidylyltransferase